MLLIYIILCFGISGIFSHPVDSNSSEVPKGCLPENAYPKVEVFSLFSTSNNSIFDFFSLNIQDRQILIPPEVSSFTLNCSFHKPIKWRITKNIMPAESRMEGIRHSTNYGNWTQECYSINFVFSSVVEGVTGLYECMAVDFEHRSDERAQLRIFSGQRSSGNSNGFLLHRGRMEKLVRRPRNPLISLNSVVNDPTATVYLFRAEDNNEDNHKNTKWLPIEKYKFHPLNGTKFNRSLISESITNFFLKVETNVSGDFIIYHYVEQDYRLHPKPGKTEIFTLPTPWPHEFKCEANYSLSMGVKIKIKDVNYSMQFSKRNEQIVKTCSVLYAGSGQPTSEVGRIECRFLNGSLLHYWKHKLYDADLPLARSGVSLDDRTRRVTCTSIAVRDVSIRFVTCNAAEECNLKSACWRDREKVKNCKDQGLIGPLEITSTSVSFQLPPISGMVHVLGVDFDVAFKYFVNVDGQSITRLRSNEQLSVAENISHKITCNTISPELDTKLECTCMLSKWFFTMNPSPLWSLEWTNGSRTFLDMDGFVDDEVTTIGEHFYIRESKIDINSVDISAISCHGLFSRSSESIVPTWHISVYVELSPILIAAITLGSLAAVAVISLGAWKLYSRSKNQNYSQNSLTIAEINSFLQGNPNVRGENGYESAQAMPFSGSKYQLNMNCLKINHERVLGSGAFGVVLMGTLQGTNEPVAIKMIKPDADVDYLKALLSELKVMVYVGGHNYIAELVGAVANLCKRELFVVLKYYSNGSLSGFLIANRPNFVNYVSDAKEERVYENDLSNTKTITTLNLIQWANEISLGMDYLTSKKVVHGDLAARNVLLDENLEAKISDFGLSRQLYQYALYVKTSRVPLPFRWMSIEALCDMNFSIQSDVWAYGITLWELFTLGEVPYPGVTYDADFIAKLKNGYRMPKPDLSPKEVYELMLSTWEFALDRRPSFSEISQSLDEILRTFDENVPTHDNSAKNYQNA